MEGISIASVTIMSIATALLAIFTWRTWKISAEQHKLYHDPDLTTYCYTEPETGEKTASKGSFKDADAITYDVILVNPGRVPIVVTNVKETLLLDGDTSRQEVLMDFRQPPSQRPARIFMSNMPWVVGNGDFSICRRKLILSPKWKSLSSTTEGSVEAEFEYCVGQKVKHVKQIAPTRFIKHGMVIALGREEIPY
ncbi:MAG: hypothetical protein E3J92_01540 [Dehalococcoidia bacterium]|nr:MAG: hypothetical protein E3J92_01540 [Dehalococcoidia bacterium]